MSTTMRTIRSGDTLQIGTDITVTARLGERQGDIVLKIEERPRFPVRVIPSTAAEHSSDRRE